MVDAHFRKVAQERMIEAPGKRPGDIARNPVLRAELEVKFHSNIPAGYTYFGQFIDHDVTFDPASSLMRQNDPNGLYNFRTPRLISITSMVAARLTSRILRSERQR
jgi:hypothetical protein